ncbi:pre-mRNA-splicing factor SYF2 [Rousettus aegyptiacus]|nr:pre-mRNA-splicing factor SYF2 [Rousettus aegyptiacus]
MDRTSSSRERHAVEATFSYAPVRPFLPRHPPPSAPLLFPPRLASPLPTLAPASFCGCAQSWPIENSSLLNGAAIGPKSLELPGRGGDYSRSSLFIGCVDGRRTEALCDVAGSAEGKIVMAAATLAEKVLVENAEEERSLAAAEELTSQKREQRLRKFRELHLKRNEARKLNHQEVVEEDKRLKLPANWEAKKARLEWELQEEEKKKECAARGEDYEKVKLLEISAEDAERWERKKKRKNPDLGFSDYAAAQLRQYHRLTKQIKPDMETYERLREKHGEEFFPTSNSLLHGTHVPSSQEIDRMVTDLEKQIEKRDKYSRRRPYNDDADIDYINERNAKFNKKAERFYGKYTAEIKQNLERGTAV